MDDLYGDLENYNEENTISELQKENEDLRHKLEEYASTLNKLQTDFDKLTLEYQKLELNYSSLLKTARAEIERKTQIITNLNLEKDKMVLKCYQNKNSSPYQSRDRDSPKLPQNYKLDKKDDKVKHMEGNRKPSPFATERKHEGDISSKDTRTDLRSKLLSLSNSVVNQHNPKTDKKCNAKENIEQQKRENESLKARASIRNRRKSMPVLSVEVEQFSEDDDDVLSAISSKDLQTSTELNFSKKQRHKDYNFQERPKSRMSHSPNLEEWKMGHHERIPDHKQRSSRYERDQSDKYRVRHKSSHKYKRLSPDRYRGEFHVNYNQRVEPERHRPRGRVLESPPGDKHHQRPSREPHQSNHKKSQNPEQERLPHQSQERYPTKRRFEHVYDEAESKRARMDPHFSRHEEDRKIPDERKLMDNKYVTEPLEIQFSSCESPDYDNQHVPTHQIREIKSTAATKLDDPRLTSKKYTYQNIDGKVVLSTVTGQNVNILPLNTIGWGPALVSMPEALLKMPPLEFSKEISKQNENITNISVESGEIDDLEDIHSQNNPKQENKVTLSGIERKSASITVPKLDDFENIEKSLQKIISYKIPKLNKNTADDIKNTKKTADDKQSMDNTEQTPSSKKPEQDISRFRTNKTSDVNKTIDVDKQLLEVAKGKKLHENNHHTQKESFVIHSNNTLPFLSSNDACEQKLPTAKQVVEGDLEMSDDNCDDNEQINPNAKKHAINTGLEKTTDTHKSCEIVVEKQSVDASEKVTLELSKDKTARDSKKSKSKKKSKHKEVKEICKSDYSTEVFEKPTKKKKKENVSKMVHIKTKFSELFDDSSSLISPEDLGLVAVAPATQLPDKSVPFSEDALDAADLNTIEPVTVTDIIPNKPNDEECKQYSDDAIINICDPSQEAENKINRIRPAITDEDIENIYKNIEPGIPEQDDVVQTVVISTGVQPPVLIEDQKQVTPILDPQSKTVDIALKAIATSTPYKQWQENVVTVDADSKPPNESCNSNVDTPVTSVSNAAVMDKSDNNTMDSQTSEINVPDVRIFVKRRRKVFKK